MATGASRDAPAAVTLPGEGVAPGALVRTVDGPRRLRDLRPGDLLATQDAGVQPVVALRRERFQLWPARAPVILRAHYLGARRPLMLAPGACVVLSGIEVEDLFGVEGVAVPAAALRCSPVAASAPSDRAARLIAVTLARPGVVEIDGCPIAVPGAAGVPGRALADGDAAALRILSDGELRHLLATRLAPRAAPGW